MGTQQSRHWRCPEQSEMSSNDQIGHMREFILHEARERSAEIEDEATHTYTLDKQRLIEAGKAKLRAEFERKEAAVLAQHKINQSKAKSAARLRCLSAQEDCLAEVFAAAAAQLEGSASDQAMLVGLLKQAAAMLSEPQGEVFCQQKDLSAVKQA